MGAAICGGVGVGLFSTFEQAVRQMVHVSRTVEPRAALGPVYGDKYRRYVATLDALKGAWNPPPAARQ